MHNSFSLRLVSEKPILAIFKACVDQELFVLFPWFLIVSFLTRIGFPTFTRCNVFETAFWLLYFYQQLPQTRQLPRDTKEKIHQARYATLYTRQQIRDSLNTLYSIIVILRNSEATIRLNRIGNIPPEHLFGRARIRCRDVNALMTLMHGLSAEFSRLQGASVLQLIGTRRRRTAVGADCE
jgi:hypothetical protein